MLDLFKDIFVKGGHFLWFGLGFSCHFKAKTTSRQGGQLSQYSQAHTHVQLSVSDFLSPTKSMAAHYIKKKVVLKC